MQEKCWCQLKLSHLIHVAVPQKGCFGRMVWLR